MFRETVVSDSLSCKKFWAPISLRTRPWNDRIGSSLMSVERQITVLLSWTQMNSNPVWTLPNATLWVICGTIVELMRSWRFLWNSSLSVCSLFHSVQMYDLNDFKLFMMAAAPSPSFYVWICDYLTDSIIILVKSGHQQKKQNIHMSWMKNQYTQERSLRCLYITNFL